MEGMRVLMKAAQKAIAALRANSAADDEQKQIA
jgi:hypothetical protein